MLNYNQLIKTLKKLLNSVGKFVQPLTKNKNYFIIKLQKINVEENMEKAIKISYIVVKPYINLLLTEYSQRCRKLHTTKLFSIGIKVMGIPHYVMYRG